MITKRAVHLQGHRGHDSHPRTGQGQRFLGTEPQWCLSHSCRLHPYRAEEWLELDTGQGCRGTGGGRGQGAGRSQLSRWSRRAPATYCVSYGLKAAGCREEASRKEGDRSREEHQAASCGEDRFILG